MKNFLFLITVFLNIQFLVHGSLNQQISAKALETTIHQHHTKSVLAFDEDKKNNPNKNYENEITQDISDKKYSLLSEKLITAIKDKDHEKIKCINNKIYPWNYFDFFPMINFIEKEIINFLDEEIKNKNIEFIQEILNSFNTMQIKGMLAKTLNKKDATLAKLYINELFCNKPDKDLTKDIMTIAIEGQMEEIVATLMTFTPYQKWNKLNDNFDEDNSSDFSLSGDFDLDDESEFELDDDYYSSPTPYYGFIKKAAKLNQKGMIHIFKAYIALKTDIDSKTLSYTDHNFYNAYQKFIHGNANDLRNLIFPVSKKINTDNNTISYNYAIFPRKDSESTAMNMISKSLVKLFKPGYIRSLILTLIETNAQKEAAQDLLEQMKLTKEDLKEFFKDKKLSLEDKIDENKDFDFYSYLETQDNITDFFKKQK